MTIKYDQDGSAYRTEKLPDDTYLVRPQIVNVHGNPCDGPLCILPKSALFDDPPQQQADGEIAEAKVALADLNERVEAARIILATIEETAAKHLARLGQQRPALKHLDDFLAGLITHFVKYEYHLPPQILTWDDAKTHQGRIKLLTLFGDSKGDLTWQQNRYCDGTGYIRTVIPCISYDEAIDEAKKLFAAHETDAMHPKHKTTPNREWAEQAAKYSLFMTESYIRALRELEASARQAKVAKLQSEIRMLELKEDGEK